MTRFSLLGLVLLVACGPTIRVTALNPSPRPFAARPPMSVEVFTTALPQRPYVEVAVLSAKGGKAEEHFPKMREQAGAMGCDALVFTAMPRDATSSGYNWKSGGVTTATTNSGSSATCVVWTDSTPAAGAPGSSPQ